MLTSPTSPNSNPNPNPNRKNIIKEKEPEISKTAICTTTDSIDYRDIYNSTIKQKLDDGKNVTFMFAGKEYTISKESNSYVVYDGNGRQVETSVNVDQRSGNLIFDDLPGSNVPVYLKWDTMPGGSALTGLELLQDKKIFKLLDKNNDQFLSKSELESINENNLLYQPAKFLLDYWPAGRDTLEKRDLALINDVVVGGEVNETELSMWTGINKGNAYEYLKNLGNGDGSLTGTELLTALKDGRITIDASGKIALTEYGKLEVFRANFDTYDEDHNGVLSKIELQKVLNQGGPEADVARTLLHNFNAALFVGNDGRDSDKNWTGITIGDLADISEKQKENPTEKLENTIWTLAKNVAVNIGLVSQGTTWEAQHDIINVAVEEMQVGYYTQDDSQETTGLNQLINNFEEYDDDGNGLLSKDELQAVVNQGGQDAPVAQKLLDNFNTVLVAGFNDEAMTWDKVGPGIGVSLEDLNNFAYASVEGIELEDAIWYEAKKVVIDLGLAPKDADEATIQTAIDSYSNSITTILERKETDQEGSNTTTTDTSTTDTPTTNTPTTDTPTTDTPTTDTPTTDQGGSNPPPTTIEEWYNLYKSDLEAGGLTWVQADWLDGPGGYCSKDVSAADLQKAIDDGYITFTDGKVVFTDKGNAEVEKYRVSDSGIDF